MTRLEVIFILFVPMSWFKWECRK